MQTIYRQRQPFTVIRAVTNSDGEPVLKVIGFTPEQVFRDEDWVEIWETHDLDEVAEREVAYETAAKWRLSLVGMYAIA